METEKFNIMNYTRLLENLQMEEALNFLKKYVNRVISEHSLGEMELKTLVQNTWYQMISVLEDQGLNADSLSYLKRDCLVKIYACSYSEDFAQVFSIIETDFREIFRKYKIDAHSSTIQNILQYIDGHYNEPLTLSSLARQFNFNYSYLSTYFHSHHSEGFSEYLNKERIRHAAELLRSDPLPISDVCEAVGYTDQSYFTRVFKKMTGITPREYRRKHGKAGE
ncbi:HTH-type transcriptional activator RhaR [Caprobacter fermentans]|uniref:HTH-type transcriptional activator RhaR n=1 Tax=Caproicibacter fermentans TaxID=2576756 RepID=A0A6N8HYV3_9FIRM|nr:helix-turn-helix domain-containing protein [Caproicibacter fermentans]MVB10858.1 HTH-type transcriptional activator RhaR [Caproicibacter fermentans]